MLDTVWDVGLSDLSFLSLVKRLQNLKELQEKNDSDVYFADSTNSKVLYNCTLDSTVRVVRRIKKERERERDVLHQQRPTTTFALI